MKTKNLFAYQLKLKPEHTDFSKMTDAVKKSFSEHVEFLESGVKSGKILIVGRTDSEPAKNFGLVVFESESEITAQAYANLDPVVRDGVMTAQSYPFILYSVSQKTHELTHWKS